MQLELSDFIKLYNRIEMLEAKVAALEEKMAEVEVQQCTMSDRPAFPVGKVSEKYKRLAEYLYEKWDRKIELSYAQIEEILGFNLPPTAYNLAFSYWANTKTHSYASSWLEVGYKAKVIGEQRVSFERNLY